MVEGTLTCGGQKAGGLKGGEAARRDRPSLGPGEPPHGTKPQPPSPFRKPEGWQPGIHQTDLFLAGGAALRGRGRLGEGEPREGREKLRARSPCPIPGRLGFFRGDVFSPSAQRAPLPQQQPVWGAPRVRQRREPEQPSSRWSQIWPLSKDYCYSTVWGGRETDSSPPPPTGTSLPGG